MTPPEILVYDASSAPVLELQVSVDNMTPSQINDLASNVSQFALIAVPGVAISSPYGGTTGDVEVDLDQDKLLAHGLPATDVDNALASQNIILPAGDQKIGRIALFSSDQRPVKTRAAERSPYTLPNHPVNRR